MKLVWMQVLIIAAFLGAGLASCQIAGIPPAVVGGIFGVATLNAPGLLKWSGNHAMPPTAQFVILLLFLGAGLAAFRMGIPEMMAGALIAVAVGSAPSFLIALGSPPPSSTPPAPPPSNLPLPPPPGGAA